MLWNLTRLEFGEVRAGGHADRTPLASTFLGNLETLSDSACETKTLHHHNHVIKKLGRRRPQQNDVIRWLRFRLVSLRSSLSVSSANPPVTTSSKHAFFFS